MCTRRGNRDIERPENSPVDCFQWLEHSENSPVEGFQWFERPENSPVESFQRERAGRRLATALKDQLRVGYGNYP
jgi:hypothetical protein